LNRGRHGRRYTARVGATKLEFERRFWFILAIYFVGFFFMAIDHLPFIVWIRHLIAPSIARNAAKAETFARIVIVIGALFVFLSAAIRTWGAAYLQTSVVHDTAQHSEALVADGPFRYTRNPLYLGSVLMAAGIGVLASRTGFFFLVIANWIFVYRLIFREEKALRQTQGESYLAYCRSVPRFWPSLRPRVASGNLKPRWLQAFAGEIFVWLFGVAELAIAVTLDPRIGYALFGLAFVGYFTVQRLIRR
jgi:protein-S-isoprenylcysteine O-methyltransferase Ste14